MSSLYVANTDNDWFDFLKSQPAIEDVNFWKPSAQKFKAIDEGELFVFRLKSPRDVIGGYGVLVSSINAPIQLAWDSIGVANGHASLESMLASIRKYRRDIKVFPHTIIGCRVLANPVFFEADEWFPIPKDWSHNIVTGKVYESTSDEGRRLLEQLTLRTNTTQLFERDRKSFEGFHEEQAKFGTPALVAPRIGQGAFRLKVAGAYDFQCALSDTRVLPALDAAHIRPYSDGGAHELGNGIFLRRDIHSVVDAGFATFDDDHRFIVSPKIKEIFNNGNEYRKLHGTKIRLPADPSLWPSGASLSWHRSNKYVGD